MMREKCKYENKKIHRGSMTKIIFIFKTLRHYVPTYTLPTANVYLLVTV